jgi:hypothetical protein
VFKKRVGVSHRGVHASIDSVPLGEIKSIHPSINGTIVVSTIVHIFAKGRETEQRVEIHLFEMTA